MPLSSPSSTPRYEVGCAGQYVVGGVRYYDDLDEAIVAAEWPPGATVYDRVEKTWEHSPTCQEDHDEARQRLEARRAT